MDEDESVGGQCLEEERVAADARAFGCVAGEYEFGRPGYPPELIDALVREAGVAGKAVIDLAAGTGKLTRELLERDAEVWAVEPVPGMRMELAANCPRAHVIDGTAESIPLDSNVFDVVTVAQAFHWFDFDQAVAEIRRVLRPGGLLAILYNERDSSVPWVAEWNELIDWKGRTRCVTEMSTGPGC